jgi:hypothetical protein
MENINNMQILMQAKDWAAFVIMPNLLEGIAINQGSIAINLGLVFW